MLELPFGSIAPAQWLTTRPVEERVYMYRGLPTNRFLCPHQSYLSSNFRLYHTIIPIIAALATVCPYANFSENKSAHPLLGCAHFAHFSICLEMLSAMQCQRRLQISRVKNIGSVCEFSGVVFCLAPPKGGLLLVQIWLSPHIHFWCFWWMALFFFDFLEAVLRGTSTRGS